MKTKGEQQANWKKKKKIVSLMAHETKMTKILDTFLFQAFAAKWSTKSWWDQAATQITFPSSVYIFCFQYVLFWPKPKSNAHLSVRAALTEWLSHLRLSLSTVAPCTALSAVSTTNTSSNCRRTSATCCKL